MLRTLPFTLVLLLALGCKREYAHFQKSTAENYNKPKKQTAKPFLRMDAFAKNDIEEGAPLPASGVENRSADNEALIPPRKKEANGKTDLFPEGLFKKKAKTVNNQKPGLFQKPEKKGLFQKKKSKKRGGLSHRSVVRLEIGLVLLGIAVIFALVHINILAIIFGLLSAFMIIRALRKLF